jgi:hypothetical protein
LLVALFSLFSEVSILYSTMAVLNYIPANSVREFLFLHILPALVIFSLFDNSHFYWGEAIFHCDVDLNFPDN